MWRKMMTDIVYRPAETTTLSRVFLSNGQTVLNIWSLYKNWLTLRRAEAKLQAMDDRMLSDIGLNRSSIETAVRKGNRAVEQPEEH